jgi:hypothetical protein
MAASSVEGGARGFGSSRAAAWERKRTKREVGDETRLDW